MIGIDTNVLVRYFTEDDDIQAKLAAKLIEKHSGEGKSILINNIVVCELIWVLIRCYNYNKSQIITIVKGMLSTIEFAFEDYSLLLNSIIDYDEKEADFADILLGNINLNKDYNTTFTFDRKASCLESFKIIE